MTAEARLPQKLRLGRHRARRTRGRCYELAWKYIADRPDVEGLVLVHGAVGLEIVRGWEDGPSLKPLSSGREAGHAWIEIAALGLVFEPTSQSFLPRDEYYRACAARAIVRVSSRQETANLLIEHRHYGPWHDEPLYHEE